MSDLSPIWLAVLRFLHDKGADLIVTFIGTLLGLLTALWLYKRQLADAQSKERTEELRRHLDHMRWFNGILGQVIDYADKQAEQLVLFTERIKERPGEHHQLAFIISRSTERLVRANNESTFHAYTTVFASNSDSRKKYLRLLAVTDYVTVEIARVRELFDHYTKSTYDRQLRLKALLEASSSKLSALLASMSEDGPNKALIGSSLHTDLARIMTHYNSLIGHSSSQRQLIKVFVQPLKAAVLTYEHQLEFGDLRTQLKDSTIIFTDIERDSLSFLGSFSPSKLTEPADRLREVNASIEKGIRHFEATYALN